METKCSPAWLAYCRERYRIRSQDPAYREKMAAKARRAYAKRTPEQRERLREKQRAYSSARYSRLRGDPDFMAKLAARQRDRTANESPEARARRLARCRAYAKRRWDALPPDEKARRVQVWQEHREAWRAAWFQARRELQAERDAQP